jgi:hypothetical protein
VHSSKSVTRLDSTVTVDPRDIDVARMDVDGLPPTVPGLIRRRASLGDKRFVVVDSEVLTYREAERASAELARGLLAIGKGPADYPRDDRRGCAHAFQWQARCPCSPQSPDMNQAGSAIERFAAVIPSCAETERSATLRWAFTSS